MLRVLHVLHHSTPHLDGYGVRSRCIIDFQQRLGIDNLVLTSAHHEIEVGRVAGNPSDAELIDGTQYHRSPLPDGLYARAALVLPYLRERALMQALDRSLNRLLAHERVDLIHAHSPVLCGLPALNAARREGVPLVYEVRAFWEDGLLSQPKSLANALKYHYSRRLETSLFKRADVVLAISKPMLEEIRSRGIAPNKLHHVPNGVALDQFLPCEPDLALARQLGVDGGPVIGFIGSFFALEGLDTLVRAMPLLAATSPSVKLVLVGSGQVDKAIRELVRKLGLQDRIIFTGQVPHADVLRYYSFMDVLVYPRHSNRVTELVTPLKPLEAMALGKAVVGSNVGGIKELLDDGRVGALFQAGDAQSLANTLKALLVDQQRRDDLGRQGHDYVHRERSWGSVSRRYLDIYTHALNSRELSASAVRS